MDCIDSATKISQNTEPDTVPTAHNTINLIKGSSVNCTEGAAAKLFAAIAEKGQDSSCYLEISTLAGPVRTIRSQKFPFDEQPLQNFVNTPVEFGHLGMINVITNQT